MNQHLQRAQLLVDQNRFDLAEQEIGQVLVDDPQNAMAHLLLSICYKHTQRYKEATREAEMAIQLQPDNSRCHLILASVYLMRDRYAEAQTAVEEALRLDPYDESNYAIMSSIQFEQRHWSAALEYAEKGLEIDPDDPTCLSMRSLSLERLGKGDVAVQSAEESLARNPDDSYAHATHAWALLNKGEHKQAQESFREALRLDPTNEFARQGMIKALNANNFLFRMILKWYTFIGRMSGGIQWAIILGLFFGQQILSQLSTAIPAIKPFVTPIIFLYFAFCITTWIADPLFNTLLRFNRFGKFLLDKRQIMSSNVMAGMVAFGLLLSIVLCLVWHDEPVLGFMIGLGYAFFMLLPISATFHCDDGYPMIIMIAVTAVVGLYGLMLVGIFMLHLVPKGFLITIFILGNVGAQFLGNYLMSVTPKK